MSRIIVFDLDNRGVGQFTAPCNRGYVLNGHPGVSGAGSTTVAIPQSVISQPWLQLGRMVLIQRPPLPPWAGMIDTPWGALLPATLTLYNAEYILATRSPEQTIPIKGSINYIVEEMIRQINQQEETYLTPGDLDGDPAIRSHALTRASFMDQLTPLLIRTGHEMILRPVMGEDRQLLIYADVAPELGTDTGFLLQDSVQGGNMRVLSATVGGKITNRITGVSGQSTADQQLQTDVLENQDSQDLYRTRSKTIQWQKVTQQSTLDDYAQNFLDKHSQPFLDLTVEIRDVGDAFANAQPGNTMRLHSGNLYLMAGVRGWTGNVRLISMAYDEKANTIKARLRGTL